MSAKAHQEINTMRIPVDSALLFRTLGMDDFELCHVLNVGATSLEVLFAHTLPLNTAVTFAVGDDTSPGSFYEAIGKVQYREPRGNDWLHVITASTDKELWSSEFLYDVVCSSADEADEMMQDSHSPPRETGLQASAESAVEIRV